MEMLSPVKSEPQVESSHAVKPEPISPRGAKGRLVVPLRVKKLSKATKENNRKQKAKERAKKRLGEQEFNNLHKLYQSLKSGSYEEDHSKADGIVMGLLQQGFKQREIVQVLGCGTSKVQRVREKMKNPNVCKVRAAPWHAITVKQTEAIKTHIASYDTEDGYPCAHRRPKSYFIRQGLNWNTV